MMARTAKKTVRAKVSKTTRASHDSEPSEMGQRLKAERLKQDLSTTRLSEITGIERTTITKLETGANACCNAIAASKIAKALKVNTDWFSMGWYPKYRQDKSKSSKTK